jgi:hypothetical protein
MRRAIQIAVTIVAVLFLATPFDCFAGILTAKAADCCAKGKCLPTKGADECCRTSVPSGGQFLVPRPHHQSTHVPDFTTTLDLIVARSALSLSGISPIDRASIPRGSPPGSRQNLPLLI